MTKRSKAGNATALGMSAKAFGRVAGEHPRERFVLKLYISGMTPRSRRAIDNLQTLCEQHLAGRYNLEIIDICRQPALAKAAQIIAVPTLVKKLPPPLRRVIGDLSDPGRVLLAMGVVPDTGKKTQKGMDRKLPIPKTPLRESERLQGEIESLRLQLAEAQEALTANVQPGNPGP